MSVFTTCVLLSSSQTTLALDMPPLCFIYRRIISLSSSSACGRAGRAQGALPRAQVPRVNISSCLVLIPVGCGPHQCLACGPSPISLWNLWLQPIPWQSPGLLACLSMALPTLLWLEGEGRTLTVPGTPWFWVLCPILGPSLQARHWGAGACP